MRSVMQLLLAALMLHAASAAPVPAGRELQGAAAAPTKPAWSIWSSAKHFFKIQSNINNKKVPGRLPGETPSPPMPTSFGVEFKHVREVRCPTAPASQREKAYPNEVSTAAPLTSCCALFLCAPCARSTTAKRPATLTNRCARSPSLPPR